MTDTVFPSKKELGEIVGSLVHALKTRPEDFYVDDKWADLCDKKTQLRYYIGGGKAFLRIREVPGITDRRVAIGNHYEDHFLLQPWHATVAWRAIKRWRATWEDDNSSQTVSAVLGIIRRYV